jgi:ankyrin repeat protein
VGRRLIAAIALFALVLPATIRADQRLVLAARNQDSATLRSLLTEKGIDVNTVAPDGATALLWAAQWDDVKSVRALIAAGADVNLANQYGVTPLHMAATNGSLEMVQALLNAGATPSLAALSGETPLMIAAKTGRLGPVQALLAKGASPHTRDTYREQTALMWATSEGHHEVMDALIAAGAEVSARSRTGFTPIMFAARNGDIPAMKRLIEHGARVDEAMSDGTTVLHVAVVRGRIDAAEFLLDRGADANATGPGYAPLHWAAGTWETYMTKDYPFADGEWGHLGGLATPLKLRLVKDLLSHGADVNARLRKSPPKFGWSFNMVPGSRQANYEGATPFLLAAMGGEPEVMRLLTASGADPLAATTRTHATPLMMAAGLGTMEEETSIPPARRIEAAALCLELGAPIDAQDNIGWAAIHAAAFDGIDPMVSFLISRGANLSIRTNRGQTPLSVAEGTYNYDNVYVHESAAKILRAVGAPK